VTVTYREREAPAPERPDPFVVVLWVTFVSPAIALLFGTAVFFFLLGWFMVMGRNQDADFVGLAFNFGGLSTVVSLVAWWLLARCGITVGRWFGQVGG
jgi:hypothetical protein